MPRQPVRFALRQRALALLGLAVVCVCAAAQESGAPLRVGVTAPERKWDDFKGQDLEGMLDSRGKPRKPQYYDEHWVQTTAYAMADGCGNESKCGCAVIVFDRKTGALHPEYKTMHELEWAAEAWRSVLTLWQAMNDYYPGQEEAA